MVRTDRGELAWEGRRVIAGDGTSISLLILGEGPTLLLVHGGLAQAAIWAWVAQSLVEDHRVVLMDRRNSGHSGWSDHVGVDIEAADVVAVLDVVGPSTVVGHSYGAVVALHAALAPGGLIERLVLYEPPLALGGPLVEPETLARWRVWTAAGRYADVLSDFYGPSVAALSSITAEELAALRSLPDAEMRWAEMMALAPVLEPVVRSVSLLTDPERYQGVTVPTLLLVGSESAEHPFQDTVRALVGTMPDATVQVLEGQRHLAPIGAPELLADSIRSFVSSSPSCSSSSSVPQESSHG